MKKILPLILPLLALLAGCLPEPSLSLDKESLSFTTAGGTETVTVSANYPWTATTSDSWIYIQYTEGSDVLTVKAGENRSNDPRSGRITIESLSLTKTISVTQAQLDAIVLKEGDLVEVDAKARQVSIKLSANVDMNATVKEGASWCKVVSTKAMTDRTATLSVAENDSRSERTAVVEFSGASASTQVRIRQSGRNQVLAMTVTGVQKFTVPVLSAPGDLDFTGYLWNGKQQSDYAVGTTLTLDPAASTSLRIEGHNAFTVFFPTIDGLTDIDFLGL